VYHQPVDDFVAAFMGTASFLPIADDATTVLGPIDLGDAAPADAVAMVRPDDIVFTASATGEAEIVGAAYHGSGWHLQARVHDGVDVYFTVGHLDAPTVGDRGTLALAPGHCQVVVPRR
jgi:ABC-type Fe3+/spermidine/putrescine transport system ATPase subunit